MANLKDTIKGLECCLEDNTNECGWQDGDNINCPYNTNTDGCTGRMMADALAALKDMKDCVNELCRMCGLYQNQHKGACDDCRWLPVRRGW